MIVSTLIASLSCLFFFKYFNFVSASIAELLGLFTLQVHPVTLNLLLPVGISFYTFQTLGYVIDVYRGDVKAEKHFGKYATFIAFFRSWFPDQSSGAVICCHRFLQSIDLNLFGIDLMKNFDSPYFSASVKEFWARWHISLSTWLRDYVYIPLGGNRVSKPRNAFNLMATFLISGLWHGANWTYVVWGGIHGFAQIAEKYIFRIDTKKQDWRSHKTKWWFSVLITFIFVTFAWIFFRAGTIQDAFYVITHMFQGISNPLLYISQTNAALGMDKLTFLGMAVSIALLILYDYFSLKTEVLDKIKSCGPLIRWAIYLVFVIFLIFNIPITSGQEFIYFQF